MTQQLINVGSIPGDGTGDKGQVPFNKVNQNFTELYTLVNGLLVSTKPITGSINLTGVGFQNPAPTGTADILYLPGFFAMVHLHDIQGTSNSNQFSFTGLPSFLIPASIPFQSMPALIVNNSAEVPNGAMSVSAGSSVLTMFIDGSTTGWTASGAKGADGNYFWLLQ